MLSPDSLGLLFCLLLLRGELLPAEHGTGRSSGLRTALAPGKRGTGEVLAAQMDVAAKEGEVGDTHIPSPLLPPLPPMLGNERQIKDKPKRTIG